MSSLECAVSTEPARRSNPNIAFQTTTQSVGPQAVQARLESGASPEEINLWDVKQQEVPAVGDPNDPIYSSNADDLAETDWLWKEIPGIGNIVGSAYALSDMHTITTHPDFSAQNQAYNLQIQQWHECTMGLCHQASAQEALIVTPGTICNECHLSNIGQLFFNSPGYPIWEGPPHPPSLVEDYQNSVTELVTTWINPLEIFGLVKGKLPWPWDE